MGKMKRVRFWPGKGKENTKRENQVRNSGKRKETRDRKKASVWR